MNDKRKCPRCGLKLDELLKRRRAGCPVCYHTFAQEISELLGLEPSAVPVGQAGDAVGCGRVARLRSELQAQLTAAVAREEYEIAAQLRDRLNALKPPD